MGQSVSRDALAIVKAVAIASAVCASLLVPKTVVATVSTGAVVTAIQRRVCFEYFWWGRDTFKLGKPAKVAIRRTNNMAFVWTEDLSNVPGAARWANFFSVVAKGDQSVVGYSYGFNLDYTLGTQDVEQIREKVFGGSVETVQMNVPADCRPSYVGRTPLEEGKLVKIEKRVASSLSFLRKNGDGQYPDELKIVIARFTADYPETLVLIPSTEEVFHVALQDAANPLNDPYSDSGEYPIQPEYDRHRIKELSKKIIAYGIMRQIKLGDGV